MPGRVPTLRFPSYEDTWQSYKLEFAATKIQDGTHFSPQVLEEGNYRYITSKNIRNGHMRLVDTQFLSDQEHRNIYKRCDVKYGDVLITKDGANTGNVCINDIKEEISLLSSVAFIRAKETVSINEYLYQYLCTPFGQKEVQSVISGQAITRITLTKLRNFRFWFPALPEQQKITAFLSAVDQKIQLLQRKKELLEQYKKGVMQKLFSQEIRFKEEDGNDYPDWVKQKLNYYLLESKLRNFKNIYTKEDVLSVSGEYGIVNQIEFQGRSFAGVSIANYHVVETGDVVYTKSPLKANPFGIIKANKGENGVVSTLYAVYKCTRHADSTYIDYYFQIDDNVNKYLRPLVFSRLALWT